MDPLRHSKDLTRPFNGPLSTLVGLLMTSMDPIRHDHGVSFRELATGV